MFKERKLSFSLQAVLFLSLSLLVYFPLANSYFAHDEWTTFFSFFSLEKRPFLEVILEYTRPSSRQFAPLSQIISYSIYLFFGMNYFAYFAVGMLLHFSTGLLLAVLLNRLTHWKGLSILGGVLFVIAPHHFQATSWVMANIGYALSSFLMLAGLILFFEWLRIETSAKASASSFFLLASVLAKEITMYIFLALPVVALLWTREQKKFLKSLAIALPGILFVLWHFLFVKNHSAVNYMVSATPPFFIALTLPLRSLAQSILPQHVVYYLSKLFLSIFPPYTFDKWKTTWFNLLVETWGAGFVVFVLCALLIGFGIFLFRRRKTDKKRKLFTLYLLSILLTAFSGLPYLFVDTGTFTLLQPRYVYTGVLTMTPVFLIAFFLGIKQWGRPFYLVIVALVSLAIVMTLSMSRKMSEVGTERKAILNKISEVVKGGTNTIIYIKSDASFYGMPDDVKILPFQAGAGKVLAAFLHEKVYLPDKLYDIETLGPLDSQGIFSDEGGSFGYFREIESLKEATKIDKLQKNSVYGFEYFSKTKSFVDITEKTRRELFP